MPLEEVSGLVLLVAVEDSVPVGEQAMGLASVSVVVVVVPVLAEVLVGLGLEDLALW